MRYDNQPLSSFLSSKIKKRHRFSNSNNSSLGNGEEMNDIIKMANLRTEVPSDSPFKSKQFSTLPT